MILMGSEGFAGCVYSKRRWPLVMVLIGMYLSVRCVGLVLGLGLRSHQQPLVMVQEAYLWWMGFAVHNLTS